MSEELQSDKIVLRSYGKVWKTNSSIYAIGNIVLPRPIKPIEILYFAVILLIIIFFQRFVPFIYNMTATLKYGVIPFLMMKFLLNKKLDGKTPQKFFIDYIKYIFTKKEYLERLKNNKPKDETLQLDWSCSISKM